MTAPVQAFYRDWHPRRGDQVPRLHILRTAELQYRVRARRGDRLHQAECGTSAVGHRQSVPQFLDVLPLTPPTGLTWCPVCLGKLTERLGVLDQLAALCVAAVRAAGTVPEPLEAT